MVEALRHQTKMTVASWYISLHISSGLIFSGRDNRQPDNMDILADIFYISNFTKMGHSTMQIFYENGLVDNLIQFGVTVTEACRR